MFCLRSSLIADDALVEGGNFSSVLEVDLISTSLEIFRR